MTEAELKAAMRDDELRTAQRAAKLMARALRDLYNEIGAVPEVARQFEKVRRLVEDHE